MIQIANRTTSLSLNEEQRALANNQLATYQQQNGTKETFKELFLDVLEKVNTPSPSAETKTVEKVPDEILEFFAVIRENEAFAELSMSEILQRMVKDNQNMSELLAEKQIEINNLTDQLAAANNAPEPQPEEQPAAPSPNDVSFTLSDDQLIIANTIQRNRHRKMLEQGNNRLPEPLHEMIRDCFFNKANLFNWGGNWYTGL